MHWRELTFGAAAAAALCGAVMLLVNLRDRTAEARFDRVEIAPLAGHTLDPAVWGRNFPRQYESFQRELASRHEQDPRLGRIAPPDAGQPRGHVHSLEDLNQSQRPRSPACLTCHAASGSAAIGCIHCHDPRTLELRSLNSGAKLTRTTACSQCHAQYVLTDNPQTAAQPWPQGAKAGEIEGWYDRTGVSGWTHHETGAVLIRAEHPQFDLYQQGIHARAGAACADCHMPVTREGTAHVSDHRMASPLETGLAGCFPCHPVSADELKARVRTIQDRHAALMSRAEDALLALYDEIHRAQDAGASAAALAPALALHRKAQWRVDFVRADRSNGFHAPQEAAGLLAETIDYARQGEIAAFRAGASTR